MVIFLWPLYLLEKRLKGCRAESTLESEALTMMKQSSWVLLAMSDHIISQGGSDAETKLKTEWKCTQHGIVDGVYEHVAVTLVMNTEHLGTDCVVWKGL